MRKEKNTNRHGGAGPTEGGTDPPKDFADYRDAPDWRLRHISHYVATIAGVPADGLSTGDLCGLGKEKAAVATALTKFLLTVFRAGELHRFNTARATKRLLAGLPPKDMVTIPPDRFLWRRYAMYLLHCHPDALAAIEETRNCLPSRASITLRWEVLRLTDDLRALRRTAPFGAKRDRKEDNKTRPTTQLRLVKG